MILRSCSIHRRHSPGLNRSCIENECWRSLDTWSRESVLEKWNGMGEKESAVNVQEMSFPV